MFQRARWRLTLLCIGLFALALGVFAAVFFIGFATVLPPAFDLAPELTNEQAAEAAYHATLERVGLALGIAYAIAVALVSVAAWVLASRTLQPIREAIARQRRFVADASHEVRTPLAAIRATAEEAAAGDGSPEATRAALARIAASAEVLSRLTNDLLLMARADERVSDRRPEPIDVSVITAEALGTFLDAGPLVRQPDVVLGPDLVVSADADEVRRIVINLVDNAVRYSGRAGAIRVATLGTERDAVVEVRDSGPGIAIADQAQIFEPFYRVRADAGAAKGSGLGLAIARSLAERNGGRLTVSSVVGNGSTFRLVLPRHR